MRIIVATAALFLIAGAWAGGAPKSWQIQEIENAPLLAVCTVQHVTPRELVPDGTTRWNATGQYYEATLLVNRAFRALRQNETITLRYISYDPNALCCANGSPLWPRLKAGDIALFPLKPASDPNAWSLVAEEGQQILVPALTNEWRTPAAPDSPRAFILHELANTLARGDMAGQQRAAGYLASQHEEPAEVRPMLESLLGSNDDQWLQTATALLQYAGVGSRTSQSISSIANWALAKGAARDYPNRLIPALIARGLDEPLKEFRDSPVFDADMIQALRRNAPQSMRLALNFIRSGKTSFLSEALAAASDLAQKPASAPTEDSAAILHAGKLIIDYGSDAQLDAMAASLRHFQATDEAQYRSLWQAINGSENERALRLDAIVITDCRIMGRDVRYCDTAVGDISRLSGQVFYSPSGATLATKDEGVARAIAWLKSNNLLN